MKNSIISSLILLSLLSNCTTVVQEDYTPEDLCEDFISSFCSRFSECGGADYDLCEREVRLELNECSTWTEELVCPDSSFSRVGAQNCIDDVNALSCGGVLDELLPDSCGDEFLCE